jgi:hypothetical protein
MENGSRFCQYQVDPPSNILRRPSGSQMHHDPKPLFRRRSSVSPDRAAGARRRSRPRIPRELPKKPDKRMSAIPAGARFRRASRRQWGSVRVRRRVCDRPANRHRMWGHLEMIGRHRAIVLNLAESRKAAQIPRRRPGHAQLWQVAMPRVVATGERSNRALVDD